ncbi:VIT domain-containing protein [Thermoflexibacter ruber]|uniref:Ca-activated chloride channel family protein n=1 Tax=Thermoflexibacter ruber TaxID=1003 RepID=A0A1I2C3P6_9BACT|nr:VIT domain-containing protein [Thermoflexibacter ruber]SFE62220.1 Ca-activated chloride channel family protein [Thermoflexibacter ruber]
MKKLSLTYASSCLLVIFLGFHTYIFAQKSEATGSEERTLSPYFVVLTENPDIDQMPLKSTSAEVNIAGVIADVKMRQVYINTGKKPLEALYVFPASTRAAVYAMQMQVGRRLIVAKVATKDQARERYEQAKAQGKTASLLEQERPNVFQMSVANIQPNDSIIVTMSYTELLVPEDGIYEFSYPTVVAPRYSTSIASFARANEKWIEQPYEQQGKAPSYTFDIKTRINAGIPIEEVSCSSHKTVITNEKDNSKLVKLDPAEKLGGNRDYIVRYRLAGNHTQSGLLTYEGKDENFFLLMLQPPKRVEETQIPPREFIFLIDASASMEGFPINVTKSLITNLLNGLRPTDYFNIMLFDNTHNFISPKPLAASQENIKTALNKIILRNAIGGTDLLPALRSAFNHNKQTDIAKTFVVITDGFVSLEKEAFDLIRNNLGEANLFSFGIGTSVNRYLIEGMAHMGMGEPFIATNEAEAVKAAEKFRKYIQTPLLTNVKVEFQGLQTYEVEPPTIPDVLAERPVLVFGKYKGKLQGSIKVTGKTGKGDFESVVNTALASTQNNQALRYLWARQKVKTLDDYNAVKLSWEQVEQILNIGLKYHLLTNYTSFVAIDSTINRQKQVASVNQALPLPQGVSNSAIGAQYRTNIVEVSSTNLNYNQSKSGGNTKRGSDGIRYALPDQTKLLGDSLVLSWDLVEDASYKNQIDKYEVQIYDLTEELLFKQSTPAKALIININKDKLAIHEHFIVKIIPLDKAGKPLINADNSEGISIHKLEAGQKNSLQSEVKTTFSTQKSWADKLFEVAKFFESQQLWVDAMNTYETASRTLKDRQKLKAEVLYQEFLERNNMSLK